MKYYDYKYTKSCIGAELGLVTCDDDTASYTSFPTNVEQFRDIDALPAEVYVGSDESADSFATHCTSWH